MSERCERTSERRSKWPSTLRVDLIVILANVRWLLEPKLLKMRLPLLVPQRFRLHFGRPSGHMFASEDVRSVADDRPKPFLVIILPDVVLSVRLLE